MADINKLLAGVEKAEEKVTKIENTIQRHYAQLEKKIEKVEKAGLGKIEYSNIQFELGYFEFEKQLAQFKQFEFNEKGEHIDNDWLVFGVTRKLKDINGSYRKLEEAKQVLKNWEMKVSKEQEKHNFLKGVNVPQPIIDFVDQWGEYVVQWMMRREKNPNEKSIRDFVENEKQIKLFGLVMRVHNAVGEILDAKDLSISDAGTLNGIVKGEKGNAKVETIMAGGWNIQCWHFRTIVIKLG